jgi:hypothetical protein
MQLGAYLSAIKVQAIGNYIDIKAKPAFFCCLRAKSRLATGSILMNTMNNAISATCSQTSAFALPWGKSACVSHGVGIIQIRDARLILSHSLSLSFVAGEVL